MIKMSHILRHTLGRDILGNLIWNIKYIFRSIFELIVQYHLNKKSKIKKMRQLCRLKDTKKLNQNDGFPHNFLYTFSFSKVGRFLLKIDFKLL